MTVRITVIGATGKLGNKLLSYTSKNGISVSCITCYKNNKKLNEQKRKYNINKSFVLSDIRDKYKFLNFLKTKINIIYFLDYGSLSLIYLNIFLNLTKDQSSLLLIKR